MCVFILRSSFPSLMPSHANARNTTLSIALIILPCTHCSRLPCPSVRELPNLGNWLRESRFLVSSCLGLKYPAAKLQRQLWDMLHDDPQAHSTSQSVLAQCLKVNKHQARKQSYRCSKVRCSSLYLPLLLFAQSFIRGKARSRCPPTHVRLLSRAS